MGRGRIVVATGLMAGALASPAHAQDPDVIVDPESPSAKEYAIPLERARMEAAGATTATRATRRRDGGKRRASPLFGVGVGEGDPPAGDAMPSAARSRKSRRAAALSRPGASEHAAPNPAPTPRIRALAAPPDSDTSDAILIGAGGGAVLLMGALLGVALRRRPDTAEPA
jgi:hypothetical protein